MELHQKARGPEWKTVEEPLAIAEKIRETAAGSDVILIDCLTLWLSNLMMRGDEDRKIMEEVEALAETLQKRETSIILVSNEVGLGIVPADPLGRRFRDLAGFANQRMAEVADKVVFMVSGIPLFLKGEA